MENGIYEGLDDNIKSRINTVVNNPVLVSKEIYLKVMQLGKARRMLEIQAQRKAKAISEYEKQRAIKILELRNLEKGETIKWEGQEIKDIPVSIIKYVAEGMVNDYKEKMKLEEDIYDFIKTTCYTLSAEMNGLQSINKYMDELPELRGEENGSYRREKSTQS